MNGARIVHLPPVGIHLPRPLRSAVNRAAHRQPHRHAVIERRAIWLWLEFGEAVALQRLESGAATTPLPRGR